MKWVFKKSQGLSGGGGLEGQGGGIPLTPTRSSPNKKSSTALTSRLRALASCWNICWCRASHCQKVKRVRNNEQLMKNHTYFILYYTNIYTSTHTCIIYGTHVATFQISMKFSDNIYLYDYDFTYIVTVVISMIQYIVI